MSLTLSSPAEVFIFIIFCSVYVCSTLWIYGDAATRGYGNKGIVLPGIFIIAGVLALMKGYYIALLVWPLGYIVWFKIRPSETKMLID